jgi:excisionase family DNA binding protein
MEQTITLDGDNRLLGIEEVCALLEVGKYTVYALMREGKLPYYDLPKRKVGMKDLTAYIESLRVRQGEGDAS